jgi:hypothetical protein
MRFLANENFPGQPWQRSLEAGMMSDPRWIDSVREVHRTSDAETDVACALASIAPTTMAGVVGLVQYAVSIRPEQWPEGVQSDDDTETRPWRYFLIEMLIAVLPGMAVRSSAPAM